MMRIAFRALCLSTALLATLPAHALDSYLNTGLVYQIIKIDGERFNPVAAELRTGIYLEKQVGLELHLATGLKEGSEIQIDTDLNYQAGLSLRLESPEVRNGSIYILGGYGISQLSVSRNQSSYPGDVDLDGMSIGLGGRLRPLGAQSPLTVHAQAVRYFSKDDVSIDGISLGVGYEF